jgi:hypothetical protein
MRRAFFCAFHLFDVFETKTGSDTKREETRSQGKQNWVRLLHPRRRITWSYSHRRLHYCDEQPNFVCLSYTARLCTDIAQPFSGSFHESFATTTYMCGYNAHRTPPACSRLPNFTVLSTTSASKGCQDCGQFQTTVRVACRHCHCRTTQDGVDSPRVG